MGQSAMKLMWRSIVWTMPVAAACIVVAVFVIGADGALGAAVGAAVVFVFFVSSPLVLGPVTAVSPHLSLVVAMTFFVTKAVALVAVMVVLVDDDGVGKNVHRGALGITLIVCTLALTVMQVRMATKSRQLLYDLDSE